MSTPRARPREVEERAYAKLNLVLHVGRPRPDGLHPLCSVFASIDLADEVRAATAAGSADTVDCPGVAGPNLATAALAAFRERVPSLPPIEVRIAKRIPVAAGLGGGSADAAAVLRAANRIAGDPLDAGALRGIAATIGSDVPSQVEPGHALVEGVGEIVGPLTLPPLVAVLVPQAEGLATAAVYAQLDEMKGWRDQLDPDRVRAVAADGERLTAALENDLQPAVLALRPELAAVLEALRRAAGPGAVPAALVTGSGPTCFALFADRASADRAAAALPGAIVAPLPGAIVAPLRSP
jgi:4-diphosphocytidyl-2-C-methyl-D-erythritol kinase